MRVGFFYFFIFDSWSKSERDFFLQKFEMWKKGCGESIEQGINPSDAELISNKQPLCAELIGEKGVNSSVLHVARIALEIVVSIPYHVPMVGRDGVRLYKGIRSGSFQGHFKVISRSNPQKNYKIWWILCFSVSYF